MAGNRPSVSGSKRFTVFERDNFTCQYCGGKPPDVALEVDHIHPVSRGGNSSITNLITACLPCNRGKRVRILGEVMVAGVTPVVTAKKAGPAVAVIAVQWLSATDDSGMDGIVEIGPRLVRTLRYNGLRMSPPRYVVTEDFDVERGSWHYSELRPAAPGEAPIQSQCRRQRLVARDEYLQLVCATAGD